MELSVDGIIFNLTEAMSSYSNFSYIGECYNHWAGGNVSADLEWKLTLDHGMTIIRRAVFVLYLVTFTFGFIGNTLTVFAILSERKLKSAASCFILNLAIADDLFIISLPFMAHR